MIPSSWSGITSFRSVIHNNPYAAAATVVGSARSITTGGVQQPNRFTRYFKQLKAECPDQIKAYADCVNYHAHSRPADTNVQGDTSDDDGSMLRQGSCQEEFDLVKDCWRTIRQRDLSQRQA
jgi:hypothetical protein